MKHFVCSFWPFSDNFGQFDFEIWVEEEGNFPTFFTVVLGPCEQCCPCEAMEQNGARMSKSDEKLPSYAN